MLKVQVKVNNKSKDISEVFTSLDRLLYVVAKDIMSILAIIGCIFFVVGLASFIILPTFFLSDSSAIHALGIVVSLFVMGYSTKELHKRYRLHFSEK